MWKKFRFFDFLEIFDELNVNSPWTLRTDAFRKDIRERFKANTAFWVIMTWWTFFIFQMALTTMLYHRVDFSEDIYRQIFLFIHSFFLYFFILSAPFCLMWFLQPKAREDVYSMFYTKVLVTIPEYLALIRKKDIIDDCIDIETEVDLWY